MFQTSGFTTIFSLFLVLSMTVKCRRYDVEEEAQKLYKEDLKTVLARFRRTPDYLKILQDKSEDLREYVHDISMQILFHYNEKIQAKVAAMMGVPTDNPEETPATPARTPAFFRAKEMKLQRNGDDDEKAGVKKLDKYTKLYSPLTLAQKNAMRDLGFEYAGHVIHMIIKSLGSNAESTIKSTKMPYGGNNPNGTTTTEHVSIHTVVITEPTTILSPVVKINTQVTPAKPSPEDKYGFRYRPGDLRKLSDTLNKM